MSNGLNNVYNEWGVAFPKIVWFNQLLNSHSNAKNIVRRDDIVFEIDRLQQKDHLIILCCDEYTMGITAVYRAINEFGALNIIYIGGGWCSYTMEAKEFCLNSNIGLYNSKEINGALRTNEYWKYHRKDKNGNPIYNNKTA